MWLTLGQGQPASTTASTGFEEVCAGLLPRSLNLLFPITRPDHIHARACEHQTVTGLYRPAGSSSIAPFASVFIPSRGESEAPPFGIHKFCRKIFSIISITSGFQNPQC